MTAAWVIQVISGKGGAPVVQHLRQPAALEMRSYGVLRKIGHAETRQRRFENLAAVVEHELSIHAHVDFPSAALELPGVDASVSRQSQVDAVVLGEIRR